MGYQRFAAMMYQPAAEPPSDQVLSQRSIRRWEGIWQVGEKTPWTFANYSGIFRPSPVTAPFSAPPEPIVARSNATAPGPLSTASLTIRYHLLIISSA